MNPGDWVVGDVDGVVVVPRRRARDRDRGGACPRRQGVRLLRAAAGRRHDPGAPESGRVAGQRGLSGCEPSSARHWRARCVTVALVARVRRPRLGAIGAPGAVGSLLQGVRRLLRRRELRARTSPCSRSRSTRSRSTTRAPPSCSCSRRSSRGCSTSSNPARRSRSGRGSGVRPASLQRARSILRDAGLGDAQIAGAREGAAAPVDRLRRPAR